MLKLQYLSVQKFVTPVDIQFVLQDDYLAVYSIYTCRNRLRHRRQRALQSLLQWPYVLQSHSLDSFFTARLWRSKLCASRNCRARRRTASELLWRACDAGWLAAGDNPLFVKFSFASTNFSACTSYIFTNLHPSVALTKGCLLGRGGLHAFF